MHNDEEPKPTNTRQERKDADRKFLILAIVTLVVVGSGAVALVYGPNALVTALPCLLGGAATILVLWLLLALLEKWRDRVG